MPRERKLVVDASAVLAVIFNEPEKPSLIAATEGTTLIAPGCLSWELGNALSAMLKRQRIGLGAASKALSIFGRIPIQEMEVSLPDALELCDRHGIYAYDAYYLHLAKRTSTPLLTLDQKMAEVAAKEKIEVKQPR